MDRLEAGSVAEDASISSPRFDVRVPEQLPYDPASVFLLETIVSIASRAREHIEEVWCVKLYLLRLLTEQPATLGRLSLNIFLVCFSRQRDLASCSSKER